MADGAQDPKHIKRTIVDFDVLCRIFDNGKNLIPVNFLYMLIRVQSEISLNASASVRIPNSEIQSEFREWIREDFGRRMTPELSDSSITLFNLMSNGSFAEFAESFGQLFFTQVPQRIFGGVETVYQDYLFAYLSSAAHALEVKPKWTTKMEVDAGDGRTDMVFYRDEGVVLELKRFPRKKKKGYRDQERLQLSNGTKEALEECDTRYCRSIMPENVTTIYEYGLAFLGPYCGVEARILKKVNGIWVTDGVYTAGEDEKRRQRMYCRDEIGNPTSGSTSVC